MHPRVVTFRIGLSLTICASFTHKHQKTLGRSTRGRPNRTERGSAGSSLAANSLRLTARSQTPRAHARATMTPPPLPDNQFVDSDYLKQYERKNPMAKDAASQYSYLVDQALSKNCPDKLFDR